MKISILSNYYLPYKSGLTEYVSQIAAALVAGGHQVEVWCWRHSRDVPLRESIDGVQVRRFNGILKLDKGMVSLSYIGALLFGLGNSDLVIPVLPMAEACLPYFFNDRRRLLAVYVCDIQLGSSFVSRIIEGISYASMRLAAAWSRKIFALSIDYARGSPLLASRMEQVVPIPPPIRVQERRYEDPADFLQAFGLDPNRKKIGFVGRIVAEKGLDILMKAIANDPQFFNQYEILIGGDYLGVAGGSVKSQLDQMMPKGVSVRFLGFIPDHWLNQFYSCLDLFVMPSKLRLEAYGIVQVEAMLCGTPVVTTRLLGVREPVMTTGMGELCDVSDPVSLAAAMQVVLRERHRYIKSRAEVIQGLALEKTAEMVRMAVDDFASSLREVSSPG